MSTAKRTAKASSSPSPSSPTSSDWDRFLGGFLKLDLTHVLRRDKLRNGRYVLYLNGERLTPQQVRNLQQEAKLITSTMLYKTFTETLREQAIILMADKAQSFDDMRNARNILYAISVIQGIVNSVDNALLDSTSAPPPPVRK